MQFLSTAALFALAAAVAADQTFTLTASGDGVSGPVTFNGQYLGLDNGASTVSLTLQEPSGYLTTGGSEYFHIDSGNGPYYISTGAQGAASKDWGFNGSNFRFGPSINSEDFFACSADSGYYVSTIQCDGGIKIKLTQSGAAEETTSSSAVASSTVAPSSTVVSTTSEVPSSSAAPVESTTSEAPSSSAAPVESTTSEAPSSSAAPVESTTSEASESASTATITNSSFTTSTVCTECHHSSTTAAVTSVNGGNKLTAGLAGVAAVAALII